MGQLEAARSFPRAPCSPLSVPRILFEILQEDLDGFGQLGVMDRCYEGPRFPGRLAPRQKGGGNHGPRIDDPGIMGARL